MRAGEIAFIGALFYRHPVLMPVLQEHLDGYDGVLPHVVLADVTRWLIGQVATAETEDPEVGAILDDMEEAFAERGEDVGELVGVSFLENLPRSGQVGAELRGRLGPTLQSHLARHGW